MSGIYQEEEYSRVSSTLHLLREVAQAEDSRVDSILHLLREVLQAEDSRIKSKSHLQRQAVQVDGSTINSKLDLERQDVQTLGHNLGEDNNDELKGIRDSFLVVSTLIATCAYTASLSPPGGFWQDDGQGHTAGTSILEDLSVPRFFVFRMFNSLSLALSFAVILIVVMKTTYYTRVRVKGLVPTLQALMFGSILSLSIAHGTITLSYYLFKIDVIYLVVVCLLLAEFIQLLFAKLGWIKTKFKRRSGPEEDRAGKLSVKDSAYYWVILQVTVRIGIIVALVMLSVKDSASSNYWGNWHYKIALFLLVGFGLLLWYWFGINDGRKRNEYVSNQI